MNQISVSVFTPLKYQSKTNKSHSLIDRFVLRTSVVVHIKKQKVLNGLVMPNSFPHQLLSNNTRFQVVDVYLKPAMTNHNSKVCLLWTRGFRGVELK